MKNQITKIQKIIGPVVIILITTILNWTRETNIRRQGAVHGLLLLFNKNGFELLHSLLINICHLQKIVGLFHKVIIFLQKSNIQNHPVQIQYYIKTENVIQQHNVFSTKRHPVFFFLCTVSFDVFLSNYTLELLHLCEIQICEKPDC